MILGSVVFWAVAAVIGVIGVTVLFGTAYTVSERHIGVLERFGKFRKLASPGLHFKIPVIDRVVKEVSLRIEPLTLTIESKTKSNAFVKLPIMVQHQVEETQVYDAFYRLADFDEQVGALVSDVVRAEVPKLSLDEAFESKDHLAEAIMKNLAPKMQSYGYNILSVQVLDVEPETSLKDAMNNINTSEREKEAAKNKAEAYKIQKIAEAEAEAAANKLHGEGIANQRKAIVMGLKESVQDFESAIGVGAEEVMKLVTVIQYMDMLKDISAGSRVVYLNHNPGAVADVEQQIQRGVLTGNDAAAVAGSTSSGTSAQQAA